MEGRLVAALTLDSGRRGAGEPGSRGADNTALFARVAALLGALDQPLPLQRGLQPTHAGPHAGGSGRDPLAPDGPACPPEGAVAPSFVSAREDLALGLGPGGQANPAIREPVGDDLERGPGCQLTDPQGVPAEALRRPDPARRALLDDRRRILVTSQKALVVSSLNRMRTRSRLRSESCLMHGHSGASQAASRDPGGPSPSREGLYWPRVPTGARNWRSQRRPSLESLLDKS